MIPRPWEALVWILRSRNSEGMQVSHQSGSDLVETDWMRGKTGLEILERRTRRLSETNPKAECECKQTWYSHLPAAHLDSGPHDITWWLSVECALHLVKVESAGNDVIVVILKGKVERTVQQSHIYVLVSSLPASWRALWTSRWGGHFPFSCGLFWADGPTAW